MMTPQKVLFARFNNLTSELSRYGKNGRAVQLAKKRKHAAFIQHILDRIRQEANRPDLRHVTQWHIGDLMNDMQ